MTHNSFLLNLQNLVLSKDSYGAHTPPALLRITTNVVTYINRPKMLNWTSQVTQPK